MNEDKKRQAAQPGIAPEGAYGVLNQKGQSADPALAIFPILRQHKDVTRKEIVGTGFFVANGGIFLTAKHVLEMAYEEGPDAPYFLGIIQFTPDGGYFERALRQIFLSNSADIGLGVCQEAKHNVTGALLENPKIRLSSKQPTVGERISTYAYPDSTAEHLGDKTAVHTYPHFYDGEIVEDFPERRDPVLLNWPCFQTSMHIHGGASGGPVFDSSGRVIGINTSSLSPDTDISYITKIQAALALSVDNVILGDGQPKRYTLEEILRYQKLLS